MYNLDQTTAAFTAADNTVERESMEYDVVIVGAGPSGLSAAIRLKQNNPETSVVVLEKGSEVGAHILSGAVLDPSGLAELFPDFAAMEGCPVKTKVTSDKLHIYGPAGALPIPQFILPPLMHNHGNYIVSMANVCRWMAEQYEPGMELHGKYVMLGEGARGSLSKVAIAKYNLADGREPSKFGLGMKEIWEIDPEKHNEGAVLHTAGWPLGLKQGGGSFAYHAENNQVFLGLIVDLALLGCTAGLVNLPRIKGNHNAMHSGIHAADAATKALASGRSGDTLHAYDDMLHDGPIGADLRPVRNVAPLNGRFGPFIGGMLMGGMDMWSASILKFNLFGTLGHKKDDAGSTKKAADSKPIDYPKPDGVLTFDRLTNVSMTFTNHGEDQPSHLRYEVLTEDDGSNPRFNINAQNCIHCKTCDIKDPSRNIVWTVPEGGGGPNYPNM